MITLEEVAALVSMIAAEQRDGWDPSETDVAIWFEMAREGRWPSLAAAKRAFIVHRSERPDYPVRAGHITQVLERVRAAAKTAPDPYRDRPPEWLSQIKDRAEFDAAYLKWMKQCAADHGQRHMDAFVNGETSPRQAIEGPR